MKISVVIPLYNKEQFIARTISNILNQIYKPLEIIVVNDGSSDNSRQIVASLNNPLIQLIDQENQGVSIARNTGINKANGDWIALLDADDLWSTNHLATFVEMAAEYPSATVLANQYNLQHFDGTITSIKLNNLPFTTTRGILSNYFQVAATSNPPLCSSSLAFKKDSFNKIGGFPGGVIAGEDLITWAKLAIKNTIAYSTETTTTFILDPAHSYASVPNRIPQRNDYIGKELRKIYDSNPNVIGLKMYLAHWHKMRASIFLRINQKTKAFREIRKSISFNPTNMKMYIYLLLLLMPNSWRIKIFKKFAG